MHNKLPTVPEEQQHSINWDYPPPIRPSELPPHVSNWLVLMGQKSCDWMQVAPAQASSQYQPQLPEMPRPSGLDKPHNSQIPMFNSAMLPPQPYIQSSSYSIISKITPKVSHGTSRGKNHGLIGSSYGKSMDNKGFQGYGTTVVPEHVGLNERLPGDTFSCFSNRSCQLLSDKLNKWFFS